MQRNSWEKGRARFGSVGGALAIVFVLTVGHAWAADTAKGGEPPVVHPGPPPSDAIVLFDGKDLSRWQSAGGGEAQWKVENGYMEVNGTGSIRTQEQFGDVQLHVEWATPSVVTGTGQERGNSGVYLQGRYEIQVLDSYGNKTYPDGQAGAFYGRKAPLVNASKPPGEWQMYDIVFRAPKRKADGTMEAGSFTVFHNGVLIHDQTSVEGKATTAAEFKEGGDTGPLILQDHGNPVRFRNIWLRRL